MITAPLDLQAYVLMSLSFFIFSSLDVVVVFGGDFLRKIGALQGVVG